VEFADDYFTASFKGTAWSDFDTAQKQGILVQATNYLETFIYGGLRSSMSQPLQWPRQGIYSNEGYAHSPLTVPTKVQQAVCEMAFWIYTEGDRVLSDSTLLQFDSFKAGPLDVAVSKKALTIPREVQWLLNAVGTGTLISTGQDGSKKTMSMAL
jgi:hypothetical protein